MRFLIGALWLAAVEDEGAIESAPIWKPFSEDNPTELKIHQFDKIEEYLINKYSDSTKYDQEFIEDLKKRLKTSINSVFGFGKKQRNVPQLSKISDFNA